MLTNDCLSQMFIFFVVVILLDMFEEATLKCSLLKCRSKNNCNNICFTSQCNQKAKEEKEANICTFVYVYGNIYLHCMRI